MQVLAMRYRLLQTWSHFDKWLPGKGFRNMVRRDLQGRRHKEQVRYGK